MPNWNEILNEIKEAGSTHDVVRRRYLAALHKLTRRNVIIYYSGWLQKPGLRGVEVSDADKNNFMSDLGSAPERHLPPLRETQVRTRRRLGHQLRRDAVMKAFRM